MNAKTRELRDLLRKALELANDNDCGVHANQYAREDGDIKTFGHIYQALVEFDEHGQRDVDFFCNSNEWPDRCTELTYNSLQSYAAEVNSYHHPVQPAVDAAKGLDDHTKDRAGDIVRVAEAAFLVSHHDADAILYGLDDNDRRVVRAILVADPGHWTHP